MANADELMAKIRCKEVCEDILEFYEYEEDELALLLVDHGFQEDLAEELAFGSDGNFLGNLGLLFAKTDDDLKKVLQTQEKAWRSFIDCIHCEKDPSEEFEVTVYFRSADHGSKEYFEALYAAFKDKIEKITITLSDDLYGEDLEFLQDEYGDDFAIEIGNTQAKTATGF